MKKYGILALTLVLTALMLTGCRNGQTPDTSMSTVPTSHATTVPTTHATSAPTTEATTHATTEATTEATHDTTHSTDGSDMATGDMTDGTEESGSGRSIRGRKAPAR